MSNEPQNRPTATPLGELERSLTDEFVSARGYSANDFARLPEREREKLLAHAAVYASGKLAEVEARCHYLAEIHDGTSGFHKGSTD